MTAEHHASQPDQPGTGDAAPPPHYRGLKTAVIVMGVLLVVGFIVLFSAIVYRAVKLGAQDGADPREVKGAFGEIIAGISRQGRVGAVTLDGDRLAVTVEAPTGSEVILFDVRRGHELGRVRLTPAP